MLGFQNDQLAITEEGGKNKTLITGQPVKETYLYFFNLFKVPPPPTENSNCI